MDIQRSSTCRSHGSAFDSEAFEAGYQARRVNVGLAVSATVSWRAGWLDADAEIAAAFVASTPTKLIQ
jgi:hypothetical protein